jgi:hypothetical protein
MASPMPRMASPFFHSPLRRPRRAIVCIGVLSASQVSLPTVPMKAYPQFGSSPSVVGIRQPG